MMKVFDFRNKTLEDVPHINEGEEFELRLDCNEICMIDSIPYYCEVLILSNNK